MPMKTWGMAPELPDGAVARVSPSGLNATVLTAEPPGSAAVPASWPVAADGRSEPGFVPISSLIQPHPELVVPAHDTLFTSGTLGRYSPALKDLNVHQSAQPELAELASLRAAQRLSIPPGPCCGRACVPAARSG